MTIVDELFVGQEYRTSVWISKGASKALAKFERKHRTEIPKLLEKVEYWAKQGFDRFEGGEGYPIKSEGKGVFRLGHKTLFRLLGFYENDDRRSFIIIDAILKSGQDLGKHEKSRIQSIATTKKDGHWEREARQS